MDKLTLVAETLLEVETLDGPQFAGLFDGSKTKEDVVRELRELADKNKKMAEKDRDEQDGEAEKNADTTGATSSGGTGGIAPEGRRRLRSLKSELDVKDSTKTQENSERTSEDDGQ